MNQFNLKFRQRVENGKYHYWGLIGSTWVEQRHDWGYPHYSEQWTGLLDKCKKEIYVGDILEYWDKQTSVVVFEKGSFITKDDWYSDEGEGGSLWVNRGHIENDCKVIGNIGDVFYPKTNKKAKTKKQRT